MPMFVLKTLQEPDLNDIKKQDVGYSKAFTSIYCRYFDAKHFPYCTCLAPDHFNVIQGWLFQAFFQVEVVSKVSAELPGTVLGDPDTLCLWPKLWEL